MMNLTKETGYTVVGRVINGIVKMDCVKAAGRGTRNLKVSRQVQGKQTVVVPVADTVMIKTSKPQEDDLFIWGSLFKQLV